jgi:hypothetical protein
MSLLIFSLRRQQIIQQKASINMRLMELQQKLNDYMTYASSISDGSISINDLMSCPASLFGRMTNYMFASSQSAMQGATAKFATLSPLFMPQMQGQDPQSQQQFQYVLQKNLYDQERERFNKVEQKLLNVEDTKIQQEMARLNTQLKMLDAEDQTVTEAEGKAAEKSAPKYA